MTGLYSLLSPSKRKFVENWIREVTKSYTDGSLCRAVLNSVPCDPDEHEHVSTRPRDNLLPDKVIRISNVHRNNKNVEYSVRNNNVPAHAQQLPAVTVSFYNVDGNKKYNSNAVPTLSARDANDVYNEKCKVRNEKRDDGRRLIIIDPQMLTPSGLTSSNRKLVPKLPDTDSSQMVTRGNRESPVTPRKETKEIYTKCKLHSTHKNGFVISRSNLQNQGTWINHSFLDIPERFRHNSQKSPRASQLTPNSKELTSSPLQTIDNGDNFRRNERIINQKLLTPAVWAW